MCCACLCGSEVRGGRGAALMSTVNSAVAASPRSIARAVAGGAPRGAAGPRAQAPAPQSERARSKASGESDFRQRVLLSHQHGWVMYAQGALWLLREASWLFPPLLVLGSCVCCSQGLHWKRCAGVCVATWHPLFRPRLLNSLKSAPAI